MTRAKDISKIITDADFSGTLDVTGTVTAGGLDIQGDGTISGGSRLTISDIADENNDGIRLDDNTTSRYNNLTQDTSGNFKIQHYTGSAWQNNLTVTTTGNVGIGTSSPSELIHANGSSVSALKLTTNSYTNGTVFKVQGDGASYIYNTENAMLRFGTNNLERMRIDASGNVGIATSNPLSILDIAVEASDTRRFLVNYDDNIITVKGSNQNSNPESLRIVADNFRVSTGTTGSGTERLRITSSGNVGINESSPSSELTVGGNATTTAKPTVAIVDTTGGATMTMRGQSPKIAFDVTSSGVPKILMDNAGLEFKTGTLDAEGDVDVKIESSGNITVTDGSISSGVTHTFKLFGATGTGGSANYVTYSFVGDPNTGMFSGTADTLKFATGGSERMRIHSGGATSFGTSDASPYVGTEGFVVALNNGVRYGGLFGCDNVANREAVLFVNPNGAVGSIRTNGSSTSYNQTSDHRLKENVTADWDATTRLKQLNPVRFNFIADADKTVDGFLAHEVQSVVPQAISGTHNEVDADGNPVYQQIDQSKIVPLLVKTIQELEARIVALETA